jgi:hypothetical protein
MKLRAEIEYLTDGITESILNEISQSWPAL